MGGAEVCAQYLAGGGGLSCIAATSNVVSSLRGDLGLGTSDKWSKLVGLTRALLFGGPAGEISIDVTCCFGRLTQ